MFCRSTPRLNRRLSVITREASNDLIIPIFFSVEIWQLKLCLLYNKSIEKLIKGVL